MTTERISISLLKPTDKIGPSNLKKKDQRPGTIIRLAAQAQYTKLRLNTSDNKRPHSRCDSVQLRGCCKTLLPRKNAKEGHTFT